MYKRNFALMENGCLYVLWATVYGDDYIKSRPYYVGELTSGKTHEEIASLNSFFKVSNDGRITFDDCPMLSTLFCTKQEAEDKLTRELNKARERLQIVNSPGNQLPNYPYRTDRQEFAVTVLENAKVCKLSVELP